MPVSACYSCTCESIQHMCILSSTPLQFGLKAFYRRHEEVLHKHYTHFAVYIPAANLAGVQFWK